MNYCVVSEYTHQLKKVGNQYFGLCPFPDHEDTNPSFTIGFVEEKHSYKFHCWGCKDEKRKDGKSGDLVDLVVQLEEIGFIEALQLLWAIKMKLDPTAKIPILESQRKKKGSNRSIKGQADAVSRKSYRKSSNPLYSGSKTLTKEEIKERRLRICRFITEFCHKYLLSNDSDAQKALKYLIEERRLTVKMIYERRIGFCQKKAMFPGDSLINNKYSCSREHVNKIVPLNLFEKHIVFPIRDPRTGDGVSFQARRVGEDGQGVKYISKNNECYKNQKIYIRWMQPLKQYKIKDMWS